MFPLFSDKIREKGQPSKGWKEKSDNELLFFVIETIFILFLLISFEICLRFIDYQQKKEHRKGSKKKEKEIRDRKEGKEEEMLKQ